MNIVGEFHFTTIEIEHRNLRLLSNMRVSARFDELYQQATSMKEEVQLVAIYFEMIVILKELEHAYEVQVPPKNMGVRPYNRSGKKMQPTTMHKKGSKIYNVGFNLKLCGPDKAISFENNPKTKHCEVNTIALTKSSPMFGTYKPGNVRGGSCGCSHLNQWLSAVLEGTPTPFPNKKVAHWVSLR